MNYVIEVILGGSGDTIHYSISALEVWDGANSCSLTQHVIEKLVHQVASGGYPYDAHNKRWALLSGRLIIDGSTPDRSLRLGLFTKSKTDLDPRVGGYLRAVFIPVDAIPHRCAEPHCSRWATNEYKVVEPLNVQRIGLTVPDDIQLMKKSWQPGDVIHTCGEHGAKMYSWLVQQPASVYYVSFPGAPVEQQ